MWYERNEAEKLGYPRAMKRSLFRTRLNQAWKNFDHHDTASASQEQAPRTKMLLLQDPPLEASFKAIHHRRQTKRLHPLILLLSPSASVLVRHHSCQG